MYTVTALEQQQRNKERVNVYLDGEFAFGLNIMDAAWLKKGQQLSDIEVTELRDKDAVVRAVEVAINFLSYRPRSLNEIRQKLNSKDIAQPIVDAALERLVELGYADDEAFCRFWVENRNAFKPRSSMALRYELRQKGVDEAIVQMVLDDIVDDQASAVQAARTKIRRWRGHTQDVFQQKIGAFLQRRGYGYGTIRDALHLLIEELETEDPTYFQNDA